MAVIKCPHCKKEINDTLDFEYKGLDLETKKVLIETLQKIPEEMTEGDIAFLRARRSYLKAEEEKKFAGILEDKKPKKKPDKKES
mgnify:CR=1 FL=1|jgi:sarcosine oxidase delta subunit|tara:strand:- start:7466 stop:7720 length:255 start_codon:yes stop_codon:yes gene_type:complete